MAFESHCKQRGRGAAADWLRDGSDVTFNAAVDGEGSEDTLASPRRASIYMLQRNASVAGWCGRINEVRMPTHACGKVCPVATSASPSGPSSGGCGRVCTERSAVLPATPKSSSLVFSCRCARGLASLISALAVSRALHSNPKSKSPSSVPVFKHDRSRHGPVGRLSGYDHWHGHRARADPPSPPECADCV